MSLDETLYGKSLSVPDDTIEKSGQQRISDRFLFRAQAILFLDNGMRLVGVTDNVSFLGVMLRLPPPIDNSVLQCGGILKVGLDETLELESCFVAFNCRVVWINDEGFGLQLVPSKSPGLPQHPSQVGSQVLVKRSNGEFEKGWTVLQHTAPLPDFVIDRIKRIENMGPVAVCYKENKGKGGFYKVMTVQNLCHIQKMARMAQNA